MSCESLATKAELFAVRDELKREIAAVREALKYKLNKTERQEIIDTAVREAVGTVTPPINQAQATASSALTQATLAYAVAVALRPVVQQALGMAVQALTAIAVLVGRVAGLFARIEVIAASLAALAALVATLLWLVGAVQVLQTQVARLFGLVADAKSLATRALGAAYQGIMLANQAIGIANRAVDLANSAIRLATNALERAAVALGRANYAVDLAIGAKSLASLAFSTANQAMARANQAYEKAVTAFGKAVAAYDLASIAKSLAETAYKSAVSAFSKAVSAYNLATIARNLAQLAYTTALSALSRANEAFTKATTALEKALEALSKALEALGIAIAAKILAELVQKAVIAVGQRVDAIGQRVRALNDAVAGALARTKTLEKTLEGQKAVDAEAIRRLRGIETGIAAIPGTLANNTPYKDAIRTTTREGVCLETQPNNCLGLEFAALALTLNAIQNALGDDCCDELKTALSTLQTTADSIETKTDTLDTRTTEIKSALYLPLNGSFDAINCVENTSTEYPYTGEGILGIHNQIVALSDKLTVMNTAICDVEPVTALPDWWQVRLGSDRPQLVVVFNVEGTRTYHNLCVPHPNNTSQVTSLPISAYDKGNWQGEIICKDNSKFVVNATDELEAQAVIDQALSLIDPTYLENPPRIHISERKGQAVAEGRMIPVVAMYFPTGQKNATPNWRVSLRNFT